MFAFVNGHKDVVQLLLDHSEGIELNARDNSGLTALILACRKGHKDVVQMLLNHSNRINMNARDNEGNTALMIAQQRGYQDIVQMIKTFYFFLSL